MVSKQGKIRLTWMGLGLLTRWVKSVVVRLSCGLPTPGGSLELRYTEVGARGSECGSCCGWRAMLVFLVLLPGGTLGLRLVARLAGQVNRLHAPRELCGSCGP